MFDIHSHVLPGVDDGPTRIQESLEMLRSAQRVGVRAIVATPHCASHRGSLRASSIADTVARLRKAAAGDPEASAVQLYAGSEIMLDPGVRAALSAGSLPTLGGNTRFALVELPMLEVPYYAEDALFELAAAGYVPVLAHPERNHELSQRFDMMLRMIKRGALMQLEAGSVVGAYGPIAQQCAIDMIDRRMCHFIASDAHRPSAYNVLIPRALEAVAARIGQEAADALFDANPAAALADRKPSFPEPIGDDEWQELHRRQGRGGEGGRQRSGDQSRGPRSLFRRFMGPRR
ncbi:MAG: tyrosine-protein phosphatase [Bacillota bacterium]|jgi:protein-tyrosine phosphatase